jgi:hypothetical protein
MLEGSKANLPLYAAAIVSVLAVAAFIVAFNLQAKPSVQPTPEPQNPYAKPNRTLECTSRETKACERGECGGTIYCIGGTWGECVQKKRICVPGKKVGCTLDSCSFGYRICNGCGTGFSECLRESEIGIQPCSGNCS